MNKFIKSALIAFTLLFSAQSMAECGMSGEKIEITSEVCDTNNIARLMFYTNYKTIIESSSLKDDQVVRVFKQKIEDDPQLLAQLKSNENIVKHSTLLIISLIILLLPFLVLQNSYVHIVNLAIPDGDERTSQGGKSTSRYNYLADITLKVLFLGATLKPIGSLSALGWGVVSFLLIPLMQFSEYSGRSISAVLDYIHSTKTDSKSIDDYNSKNINVEYDKYESKIIIEKLARINNIAIQTDKAFSTATGGKIISDFSTFIHDSPTGLDFYRKSSNSQETAYNQGKIIIPVPDLTAAQKQVGKNIKLQDYITNDKSQVERLLIELRRSIIEEKDLANGSSIGVDNIIDMVAMHSFALIKKDFYREIFVDGSLRDAFKPVLNQACYDAVGSADSSKKYLEKFLSGSNPREYTTNCIFHNGQGYEVLGLGSDAVKVSATASRDLQNGWRKETDDKLQAIINRRHELIKELAAIRIAVGITDTDSEIRKEIVRSSFNFFVYATPFIFNSQRQDSLTRSMFLNSGELVFNKGSDSNYINYQFLSKSNEKAFADSNLDFGFYDQNISRDLNSKEKTYNYSTTSILWETAETATSTSEFEGAYFNVLMNPVEQFKKQLVPNQNCREKNEDCNTQVSNSLENLAQYGTNLKTTAINMFISSMELSFASKVIAAIPSKKPSEKGGVSTGKKSNKYGKSVGIIKDITSTLAGISGSLLGVLSTILLILGVFFSTVLGILVNFPFVLAIILISLCVTTLPVLVNLFCIWASLANDKNNMIGLLFRMFIVWFTSILSIPILMFAKVLSLYAVSIAIYVGAWFVLQIPFPFSETINGIVQAIIIFFLITPLIMVAFNGCWAMYTLFHNILGTTAFIDEQVLEFGTFINSFLNKFVPIAAFLRTMYIGYGFKSLRQPFKKPKKKTDTEDNTKTDYKPDEIPQDNK